MSEKVFEITSCEVCGNDELFSVLDLGKHPMCDDLVEVTSDRVCKEYPIEILFCKQCLTAHQKYQVPKDELFPQTYHYRSRFTADVLNGMKALVAKTEELAGSVSGKKVLDIGCNDGSLLDFFKEKGAETIGIEPTDASIDARKKGHAVYNEFLSLEVAEKIVAEHGQPDFISFTNVFAHIEDLGAVIKALQRLASPTTVFIIENHYLGAVIDRDQFDTFYHEHPRTYSFKSFQYIAKSLGYAIMNVEFPVRYGGNIQVFIGNREDKVLAATDAINAVEAKEAHFFEKLELMSGRIAKWKQRKKAIIDQYVQQYGPLRAKAFPGRAAILVKLLELDKDTIEVTYEKPGSMKIGHYLPGTRIPIASDDDLFSQADKTLPIVNFAWHISKEISAYLRENGYTGEIIDVLSKEDFE